MTVQTKLIEYTHDGVILEGYLAWDDAATTPAPGVLVSHAWGGRSEFECARARQLAEAGYVGFALDLYGKGVLGSGQEQNAALMQPFLDDRPHLQSRLQAAVELVRAQPEVDAGWVAAMGYCFGGLCVLDLARTGTELRGVVSIHGLFHPPGNTAGKHMSARVLVLHGWDDPMATPENFVALAKELSQAGADWQAHAYGNTMHAFTNPQANDPAAGTVYDADADRRSFEATRYFLRECLGS